MKEAYITGAGGFVGRHLTEKLDDFVAIPHQELDQLQLEPYKKFFFLSTYGNMSDHDDAEMIVKANVLDLVKVLSQTDFENGVTSFVYMSSSSVTRRIQTMYSRAKRAAEEILLGYMEKYNAPICIIRPFSVTGVGEQREHLIPKLIDSCMNGTKMPFIPWPTHDYIDVDDVVDGILTLSRKHAKGIFELGTGVSHTNEEVLEMVEVLTGKEPNLHYVKNMRPYDSDDWVSKNFSARQYGWKPKKTLAQSIGEMLDGFWETAWDEYEEEQAEHDA